ncbi:hypothetical protein FIU87_07125 [Bacillus sp. THAF10]|uniref:hypothetical protein n=1 Tax=Bacillus sp. THAF10 TaxID=2587848 RepID=UPI0012685B5E|nr:hypothetical protein [Bacillus sp. THAF10]QFT88410.1 hypothetical protein FIU87_07125 [Bacillus sp. THAF10]
MTFAENLSLYVNRDLEVYGANQFFVEGILRSVGTESFEVEVRNGSYVTPTELITVFFANVEGIRVLATS